MKKLFVIGACLLLAACGAPEQPSTPQLTDTVTLMVHWASLAEINAAAKANGDPQVEREGYTVLHRAAGATIWTCDIYMGKPSGLGGPTQALVGHELLHCLYGSYHP